MAKSNQSTSTRKQERQEKAERKKAAEKKRRQRAALKEDAVESERKKARIGMSKSREKMEYARWICSGFETMEGT